MGRLARTLFLVLLAATLAGCGLAGVGSSGKSEADLAADAFSRGLKAQNAGKLDEATQAYFEALSHDPKNKFAFFNLGIVAQSQKKPPQIAEGYYRSALEIDPKFASALFNLAIIRTEAGDKAGAIELYRRDLQVNANDGAVYFNLALLLRDTGQTAEANQMFQRAQQLDPKLVPPASPSPTPTPTRTASPSPTR